MKRIISIVMLTVLALGFCGCSQSEAISNDGQEYIVSALGFDKIGKAVTLTLEALIVNSEDMEEEKQNRCFFASAESIETAYNEILNQTTQPVTEGHCGAVVIGKNIDRELLTEILDFCTYNNRVNISAFLVQAENAKNLLCGEKLSSVAVGYDIMSVIEVISKEKGMCFKNRIYEVSAALEKPAKTFYLPYIEGSLAFGGVNIIKNGEFICNLTPERAQTLFFITDAISEGSIVLKGKSQRVQYCKVTYDFSFSPLIVDLNLRIGLQEEREALKKNILSLFYELAGSYGDVFAFEDIVYQKHNKRWSGNELKNAELRVNIYEK